MIPLISLLKKAKKQGVSLSTPPGLNALTSVSVIAQQAEAAGQPITFGMPFKQGDFPSGSTLTAKIGGVDLPIQIDRKAEFSTDTSTQFTRRDTAAIGTRSVLNAVVSTHIPAAQSKDDVTVIDLYVTAGSDRTIGTPLAFPSRTVEIEVIEGATSYTADLSGLSLDAAQAVFGSGSTSDWLSGPDCREWQIQLPLKNGGTEHTRLTNIIGVRHYATGQTRFELIVENTKNAVMGNSVTYDIRLKIDSVLRYTEDDFEHYEFARWRRTMWDTPREVPHIDFEPEYLVGTKIIPNYTMVAKRNLSQEKVRTDYDNYWETHKYNDADTLIAVSPKREYLFKTDLQQEQTTVIKTPSPYVVTVSELGPMGIGVASRYMGATSGRVEISPLPAWQANWVVDQQLSQYMLMLRYAECSGSWDVHFRDASTGNMVSVSDYPTLRPPDDNIRSSTNINPYKRDKAHQPSYAFLPYLVTGDAYFLEEVQSWATFNVLTMVPEERDNARGIFEVSSQARGWAWGLRNLGQAAIATPDTHPLKANFMYMAQENAADSTLNYITNPGVEYGVPYTGQYPIVSFWMDDYVTWCAGYMVDLGFTDFTDFAEWKGNCPTMRMGYGGDWCAQLACTYHVNIGRDPKIPLSMAPELAETTVTHGRYMSSPKSNVMLSSLADCFDMTNRYTNGGFDVERSGGNFTASHPCGSSELSAELGLLPGEINGNSGYWGGYTSQMGPALASAVNMGTDGAAASWAIYAGRTKPADPATGMAWSIVPRA